MSAVKSTLPLLTALALMIVAPSPCRGEDSSLQDAAVAARAYLQAYFRGDAAGVVALIHPEALAEGKRLILAQYELAAETGSIDRFQAMLGLEGDPAQLVDLDPRSLYRRLIEAEHRDMSAAETAALDQTQVLVTDTRYLDPDIARVSLSLVGPGRNGYIEQTTVIDLALHEDRWLVLGDSPEP
jgi:hypothetical protein